MRAAMREEADEEDIDVGLQYSIPDHESYFCSKIKEDEFS